MKIITKAKIEALVEEAFYKVGYGVQINIMNLSKINKAGVDAYLVGGDVEAAVAEAVAKYREN